MANKALLVGSDYLGTENQLNGCGNDVRDIGEILQNANFTTTILTDVQDLSYANGQPVHVAALPNKNNILLALKNMIRGAKPDDKLLFYYSGHGTQIPSATDGSEQDFIVPLDAVTGDFDQSMLISSDELHKLLIQVPPGVKLLMVADSCFSGNITEFDQNAKGLTVKQPTTGMPFKHLHALISAHPRSEKVHGALTLIAGCKSTQESADLGTNGALTFAIKAWIAKHTLKIWLDTCWTYTGNKLSVLKANLTATIKNLGVTDQDPQISYDKDTGIVPTKPIPARSHTEEIPENDLSFLSLLYGLHQNHVKGDSLDDLLLPVKTLRYSHQKRPLTLVHSVETPQEEPQEEPQVKKQFLNKT